MPRPWARVRMPRDGYRAVGLIERPVGLKGELKARPLTDFPERFEAGAAVFINGERRTIARSRWQKDRVYLHLDGVVGRPAADEFRDLLMEVPEGDRPAALGEGAWYIDEIEGLRVVTTGGEHLGTVSEVLQTGANDVYVVSREGGRDVLVPALRDVVREVDTGAGRMVVDLPDGLLPAPRAGV